MKVPRLFIEKREVSSKHPPFVTAEIGINHGGDFVKAKKMIDDAAKVGCECVKFQTHILEEEMIPNDIVPSNAEETIWKMMKQCSLSKDEEKKLKKYTESKGLIFLSTPFSKAAVDRLNDIEVSAFKIGSGECSNYPLVEYIASIGKPVILSTGMNSMETIATSVKLLRDFNVPFALLHCTSMYPTPDKDVRLGAMVELKNAFKDAVIGLSDHSLTNYPAFGAVALGASIIERHFTSDKSWPGPDIEISMDRSELKQLIEGSNSIFKALGGSKEIIEGEESTIKFAYASVVSIKDISKGEALTKENIWVKRPGTGEIIATEYYKILGKKANQDINKDQQIMWRHIGDA